MKTIALNWLIALCALYAFPTFANGCDESAELPNLIECTLQQQQQNHILGNPIEPHCPGCEDRLQVAQARTLPALSRSFSDRGANCTNFIASNGSYGPYGQIIHDYVTNPNNRAIFFNNNIPEMSSGANVCPRWAQLSDAEKAHFWAWTFAAIAWDESTCRPNARNGNASNGVAIGLLQLNEDRAGRSWRGSNCRVSSVAGANENLLCGLDIMRELMRGSAGVYRSSGAIFSQNRGNTNSYWEKLRRAGGGTIGERIRTHPLCQNVQRT